MGEKHMVWGRGKDSVHPFFLKKKKERKKIGGGVGGIRLSFFLLAVAGGRELVRGGREVVLDRGVGDLFFF